MVFCGVVVTQSRNYAVQNRLSFQRETTTMSRTAVLSAQFHMMSSQAKEYALACIALPVDVSVESHYLVTVKPDGFCGNKTCQALASLRCVEGVMTQQVLSSGNVIGATIARISCKLW